MRQHIETREIRHFHMFCGLGGGAKGFNRGRAEVGNMRAKFRCIGGVDVDPAGVRDFEKLAGAKGTCLDLFDRAQYRAFHGHEPPAGWGEATPEDIRKAAGYEHPHIVFMSAPCKGFSGLLSETKSLSEKYQALNRLTLRGIWLMLEAFADDPPDLIIFENVPRIATRGRWLLDQIGSLYRSYSYAVAETTHDCGEIGELAQSRKRFLMVARHTPKVPAFLYEPHKKPLRAVGDILGRMPLPGDPRGGAMHLLPNLQWKTWVRLAFVEAGSDWRSLNKLRVVDGKLADYLIVPDMMRTVLGVTDWQQPANTVIGNARPLTGKFSVADPRAQVYTQGYGVCGWNDPSRTIAGESLPSNGQFAVQDPRFNGSDYHTYGVRHWGQPAETVTGQAAPGAGAFSVADPRMPDTNPNRQYNVYRVIRWDGPANAIAGASHTAGGAPSVADPRIGEQFKNGYRIVRWAEPSQTITSGHGPSSGGMCVADPRPAMGDRAFGKFAVADWQGKTGTVIGGDDSGAYAVADPRAPKGFEGRGKYKVTPFSDPANTVIAESGTGNGAFAVADPRILNRDKGDDYLTGGHYGVVPWDGQSYAVSGAACHDNGPWSVADPRMPEQDEKLAALILSLDGTWHRPFTTLELAALQSLVDPDNLFDLDGSSDSAKRERIGNAVPPYAAQAIADMMGQTLLLSWSGESFRLSAQPVWVQPVAVALSVRMPA